MKNWLVTLLPFQVKPLARKKVKCSPTFLIHPVIWNGLGDHAEALINLTDYLQRKNVEFSEAALQELADIYQKTTDFIKDALDSVENNDVEKAQSLIERHKEINNMERVLRKTHIKRLNNGECSTQAGVNFIDIISHYTRVSDHAMNLAEKVLAEQI